MPFYAPISLRYLGYINRRIMRLPQRDMRLAQAFLAGVVAPRAGSTQAAETVHPTFLGQVTDLRVNSGCRQWEILVVA